MINTFKPPEGTKLVSDWGGEPIEFFDNSSYSCASQDLYFEMDREKVAWNMTCLDDGSWDVPEIWPVCLHCEHKQGIHHWVLLFNP